MLYPLSKFPKDYGKEVLNDCFFSKLCCCAKWRSSWSQDILLGALRAGSFKGRWHWMLCTQLAVLGPPTAVALWRCFVRPSPPVAWELSESQGGLSHKVLPVKHCFFLSRALLKTFSRWRTSCEGKMLWSGTAVPSLGCSAVVGGCRQPLNQAQHCNTTLFKLQY